tara:strand:+ start:205 stop:423 length:219 start_codon:yes stop_codon:yes gene_type:complete
MSKEKDTTHRAILRSNPHKMVKLPREVIEELGWKIDEKLIVEICNVENTEREEWREVIIAKESDEDKIYKEI